MIYLNLGEYAITNAIDEQIVTLALGSCVALIIHCPYTKCTAMAHIVLPKKNENNHANYKDAYFASEFVPALIEFFINQEQCDVRKLEIKLVGGSESKNGDDVFQVGPKNVKEITSILESYNLKFDKSDTLGSYSRTVEVEVKSGKTKIRRESMII